MENTYAAPPVSQVSGMPKTKNYFVIALVLTISACIIDGVSDWLIPAISSLIDNYLAQNIISYILYLMSDIVEFATVFFGFVLITKNKIAAFRFSGSYFLGMFAVNEISSVIDSVVTTIMYSNGYYDAYYVFSIIQKLFDFILIAVLVPLCFNIINNRKINHTINIYQKKAIQTRAVIGVCAIHMLSLTSIIYSIWNMVSGMPMLGWMIINIIRFFVLIIFVAALAVYFNSFRKDSTDIIALFAMILFPRIITFLAGDLLSIISVIVNSFVYSGIVSIIVSVLNILVSVGVSIAVINFTLNKFFPVVNNIPTSNNFSAVNNYTRVAANPIPAPPVFTAPVSGISPDASEDFDATVRQ